MNLWRISIHHNGLLNNRFNVLQLLTKRNDKFVLMKTEMNRKQAEQRALELYPNKTQVRRGEKGLNVNSDNMHQLVISFLIMFFFGFLTGVATWNQMTTKKRIEPDMTIEIVNGVPDTTFIYVKQD